MKESILISCTVLIALSLTAISLFQKKDAEVGHPDLDNTSEEIGPTQALNMDRPPVDFFYDVDSRFMMTITKEELNGLESIEHFLRPQELEAIQAYDSVSITLLDDWRPTEQRASGPDQYLTMEQKDLLNKLDYSANILVRADYKIGNAERIESRYSTPHITIVPERQAEYEGGKEALIEYLKARSMTQTAIVSQERLKSGMLYFTVNRFGMVTDLDLVSSCGYPSLDLLMTDLIADLPGSWSPAMNGEGRLVEQTFVYSFGVIGC